MPCAGLCSTLLLCLLSASTPPLPDEGYDLLVLDMPGRAVMGDLLPFSVNGRPGNPYVVLGDVGRKRHLFGLVTIHLDLSPALFMAAGGMMPPGGASRLHTLRVPNLPKLDGTTLWFQAFGTDKGVIRGFTASDGKPVTFHARTGQPLINLLTVNRIPRDQNGSELNEGTLFVPPTAFTIDLFFRDRRGAPIDPKSLTITADKALGKGQIKANTNLARFFAVSKVGATARVAANWAFPAGNAVTLTATIKNVRAIASPKETYRFQVRNFTPFTRPFAQKQLWLLDFDRHDLDNSGVPDYREDLVLFGLGDDPKDKVGPAAIVNGWTRAAIQAQLRRNFQTGKSSGINVDFFLKVPAGVHATICIGGRNRFPKSQLPPGAQETTGAAFLNPHNQNKRIFDCFGLVGVHPRSVYHLFKNVPAFKRVFDPLQANPVGKDPDDRIVTAPGFNLATATSRQRLRFYQIKDGVVAFARSVAFILTQETCHSMGLVLRGKFGFGGMLGGLQLGHSTRGHFDDGRGNFLSGNNSTPAPAKAANLSLVWDHFQSERGHFTALNWAYLREQIINL